MGLIDDVQEGIEELVTDPELGTKITLRRDEGTVDVDGDKPWKGKTPDPQDYETKAGIFSYTRKEIDNKKIRRGDKKVIVSLKDLPITPAETDRVFLVGTPVPAGTPAWSIVEVSLPELAGQTYMAVLQIRR